MRQTLKVSGTFHSFGGNKRIGSEKATHSGFFLALSPVSLCDALFQQSFLLRQTGSSQTVSQDNITHLQTHHETDSGKCLSHWSCEVNEQGPWSAAHLLHIWHSDSISRSGFLECKGWKIVTLYTQQAAWKVESHRTISVRSWAHSEHG